MPFFDEIDLGEIILAETANRETITNQVEDTLRMLIRGIASQSPGRNASLIIGKLGHIIDLAKRCDCLDEAGVLSEAMNRFAASSVDGTIASAFHEVARQGTKYFIEASASDGFAGARVSKCRSALLESILYLNTLRGQNRQLVIGCNKGLPE